jgi:hypothetical protein
MDPVFVTPRMLPRVWGRADLGDWCASAPRPDAPIGEVCALHAYNATESGEHLGKLITDAPADMLGDLGRAPPALRLVLTDAHTGLLRHNAPALWRVLEAEAASTIDIVSTAENDRRSSTKQCKSGDTYRVGAEGAIGFSGGVVAVEARANFRPRNADTPIPPVARLAARTRADDKRIALLREPSLSVEVWTLPARSRLTPDGETCHALMALSPGIAVDGRPLAKGEVVFVPAYGRNLQLTGANSKALIVYPDREPTSIWQRWPTPDPGALALRHRHPAHVEAALADAAEHARYPRPTAPARLAA